MRKSSNFSVVQIFSHSPVLKNPVFRRREEIGSGGSLACGGGVALTVMSKTHSATTPHHHHQLLHPSFHKTLIRSMYSFHQKMRTATVSTTSTTSFTQKHQYQTQSGSPTQQGQGTRPYKPCHQYPHSPPLEGHQNKRTTTVPHYHVLLLKHQHQVTSHSTLTVPHYFIIIYHCFITFIKKKIWKACWVESCLPPVKPTYACPLVTARAICLSCKLPPNL